MLKENAVTKTQPPNTESTADKSDFLVENLFASEKSHIRSAPVDSRRGAGVERGQGAAMLNLAGLCGILQPWEASACSPGW